MIGLTRDIFFYGLFMDERRLRSAGFSPVVVGRAFLDGYSLEIERRATLEPRAGSRSYGIVMTLRADEAKNLYGQPSVADYVAEQVTVTLLESQESHSCWCYNLPAARVSGTPDQAYRLELAQLLDRLGFPGPYVRKVAGESPGGN